MELEVERHTFMAKWYLNGFPKSGLHLLALILRPMARPMVEEGPWDKPWAGTFANNSWTNEWVPLEKLLYKVSRLQDAHYFKAHTGYKEEVERFLWYSGISHIFVYRDLRDVAVSQSYHVVAGDDTRFSHPNKDLYRSLDSHEEVLKAVIAGIDKYPGVFDRWEQYAGWLDVNWVRKVRFEDLRNKPHETVRGLVLYGLGRVAPLFNYKIAVNGDVFDLLIDAMVAEAGDTDRSITFRKGTIGQWREEFTPEIVDLFKEHDKNNWLVRLGYEENDKWRV